MLKVVTDKSGTWSLDKTEVDVRIGETRHKLRISLDSNGDTVVDLGTAGITLNTGDVVQIKGPKLLNPTSGSYSFTFQVIAGSDVVAQDTVTFVL